MYYTYYYIFCDFTNHIINFMKLSLQRIKFYITSFVFKDDNKN